MTLPYIDPSVLARIMGDPGAIMTRAEYLRSERCCTAILEATGEGSSPVLTRTTAARVPEAAAKLPQPVKELIP